MKKVTEELWNKYSGKWFADDEDVESTMVIESFEKAMDETLTQQRLATLYMIMEKWFEHKNMTANSWLTLHRDILNTEID